jgi:uncharacterized heparinase superfamily protein
LFYKLIIWNLREKIAKILKCNRFIENFKISFNTISNIQDISLVERYSIIRGADEIKEGYIDLLGSGKIRLKSVNWHSDFKSGFVWPKGKFFRDYDQEMIGVNCDVKAPRELSRSHHILKVAVAYRLTDDERYVEYCIRQLDHWIDENPLMYSINWGCTMDVAIRAINWVHILRLIMDSDKFEDKVLHKIVYSLYEHGWYIYRNPEKAHYNNHNHYLADLAGQIYLGILFSAMVEPKEWLNKGIRELFHEIRLQILPTGMSYERSTNYNRLVLELILWPILLLKQNNYEIPSDIWYRIEKMFEFIMFSLKPDGTSPVLGDQDNGRLLPFGAENLLDFRYLLSIGAVLFQRNDFYKNSNGYNIYTSMLGSKHTREIFNLKEENGLPLSSTSFKDTGLYIMRSSDNYLIFNLTGKGKYAELPGGCHTHSDLLSFELFTFGKTFLVDPGSYIYTPDLKERMHFRSTHMHNTVTVDGLSQNELAEDQPWGFDRNAIPDLKKWESNEVYDQIIASHTGYLRLSDPVTHTRSLSFIKADEKWIIEDLLEGQNIHLLTWHFNFDADIDFEIVGNTIFTRCPDKKNISLTFYNQDELKYTKIESFVSKSYGLKEASYALNAVIKVKLPFNLRIEISKNNT